MAYFRLKAVFVLAGEPVIVRSQYDRSSKGS